MGVAHAEEREAREETEGRGMLLFLGEPVFDVEVWIDGEQVLARPVELDLVGIGETREEAVKKLGDLIIEYLKFLHEEGEDRTSAEEAIFALILERIGPPLVKYHMRRRSTRVTNLLRSFFGSHPYWGASSSKLVESDKVLPV